MTSATALLSAPSNPAGSDPLMQAHRAEARRLARYGALVLLVGLLPAAAWLLLAPLSSAVIAPAVVKVDLDRRPVQHAEGGIVREVRVRDGQHVQKGEPLLLLGDVAVAADVNRVGYRVNAEQASQARLEAEQAMAARIEWPKELLAAAAADPRLTEQMGKETALFNVRRDTVRGETALMQMQRGKLDKEIVALGAQIEQAGQSLAHQKQVLDNNRGLLNQGFISRNGLTQIEASVSDYSVKLEERRADLARAEQRAVELDLKIRSLTSEYRQQASDQLKLVAGRLQELQQEQRKSIDSAARQFIVAPVAGEVIGLRISSPGMVVAPRESIADIVPDNPTLVIEAQIRTDDINRVQRGQAADIRFVSFKSRSTELIQGKVLYVSADRLVDRQQGFSYYTALVEADAAALQRAGGMKLIAGMPAEVFIKGEERTPFQYLIEPVLQSLQHAARER
ncbi:MAG: HlyD family type I secretion periplasmic adaptor subunit [Caldimonas sp.]